MKSQGLRTAIYGVDNLQKGKDWYARVFETEAYFDEPYYVGFNIAGYELGLIPDAPKGLGSVMVYWGVEDIEASFQDLIAAGATEHEKPNDVGGGIQVATVQDPWGNLLGIINNPHFKL